MSEQILTQILGELKSMNTRMDGIETRIDGIETHVSGIEARIDGIETHVNSIDTRMSGIESHIDGIETDLKNIRANTDDIPLIRQAVLETLNITKQIESSQKSFERKTVSDINTHDYSIDILNRRQLKVEAELEILKSK